METQPSSKTATSTKSELIETLEAMVTHGNGKDEYWGNWFVCPKCGDDMPGIKKHCANCGIKLAWPDKLETIIGYE